MVNLLERVDQALEKLTKNEGEQVWMDEARQSLTEAESLTEAFRTVAERNDMLMYYYMGEYEAKVSWLKAGLYEQRDDAAQRAVTQGRHFNTILQLLYEEKTLHQKDIVERLGITRGNTFLHMKGMIEAGFVEEGRDRASRIYHLTPAGKRYYEENVKKLVQESPPLEKAKREQRTRQKTARKPVTVLNKRNFSTIMQILYETGDIPLTDLCTRLERPHGNVYRDMRNLTIEGFVKKETVRHCNYYMLSDKGKEYCEACFN